MPKPFGFYTYSGIEAVPLHLEKINLCVGGHKIQRDDRYSKTNTAVSKLVYEQYLNGPVVFLGVSSIHQTIWGIKDFKQRCNKSLHSHHENAMRLKGGLLALQKWSIFLHGKDHSY